MTLKNKTLFKRTNKFGDPQKFNKKYADSDFSQNTILADEVYMGLNNRKRKNNNVLVIGGSGTGKSRSVIQPNLLQANCSYVITDVGGTLLKSQRHFLEQKGYKIKVFDLTDMSKSSHYNPFNYIRDEKDVVTMVDSLIKITNGGKRSETPSWEVMEKALLLACCFYLIETVPKEEQNFANVMELLNAALSAAEITKDDPDDMSLLDVLMNNLEKNKPESIAVENYKFFKMMDGKSIAAFLIIAGAAVRLQVFNFAEVKQLTNDDTLDLISLGDEKQALFIVLPQNDSNFNFLASMLISQLINMLKDCIQQDGVIKPLKTHVSFLLDDFAELRFISELDSKIDGIKGYNISFTIVLQSLSQLKAMYKDNWEAIVDNCAAFIFFGCRGKTTLKYVENRLKCAAINACEVGLLKNDYDYNFEFMSYNGAADDCIVFVRGERPICAKKYNPANHPNFAKERCIN